MEKFDSSQFKKFREEHKDVIETESYGKEFEDDERDNYEKVEPTKDVSQMYETSIESLYPKIMEMIDKDWKEKGSLTETTRRWVATLDKMSANFLNIEAKNRTPANQRVIGQSEVSGMLREKIKEDQERLKLVEERTKELEQLRKNKE